MTAPVDLRERYGDRYKVSLDPAATSWQDPWYYQIRGRYGVVYPYGGDQLAVEVDYHPKVATRLAVLGLELLQDGDEETFVFPVDRFEEVAAIVHLYRRPQLTEAFREYLRQRVAAFNSGPGKQGEIDPGNDPAA